MAYRRRYRGNRTATYIPKSVKYQFVPFTVWADFTAGVPDGSGTESPTIAQCIVPSSTLSGIRKVKNFTIDFCTDCTFPVLFYLIYLPEGARIQNMTLQANVTNNEAASGNGVSGVNGEFTEMFGANQWVIGCGTLTSGAVTRYKTRLSRNLNGGDTVWLCFTSISNSTPFRVNATGNYAIRYN